MSDTRTIAVEDRFVTPSFVAGPSKGFLGRFRSLGPRGALIAEWLSELSDKRVTEMPRP